MLDLDTRTAILRLRREGHGTRAIARAVGVARDSVVHVLREGRVEVPENARPSQLSPHLDKVRELHRSCGGNVIRVHEELVALGIAVPYSTVTRFCREHQIGVKAKQAAGRYHFEPGQEMQHDTSPHDVKVGDKMLRLQCASLVMCFSRRRFIQCYRRWTRFHVKVFLTAALRFFDGAANQCMLDNSTVIMTGGTGALAHAVPEMEAFALRFGFKFVAHEKGDANRSARVEAPFFHVENNFYKGRAFADLADLNRQAIDWCRKYNASVHDYGVPDELAGMERFALKPLPAWIPEPTEIHIRKVNAEAYVTLHTNRYSVAEALIDRDLEVHEALDSLRIFDGHRLHCEHVKRLDGAGERVTLPEHRGRWKRLSAPLPPCLEEAALRAAGPALGALCDALRAHHGGQGRKTIRQLHRIWLEYPDEAVERAVARALEFGLIEIGRIEHMVLENVRGDYFKLPTYPEKNDG